MFNTIEELAVDLAAGKMIVSGYDSDAVLAWLEEHPGVRNAAVAYSGRDYRCFTMGFPLECIKDSRIRDSIMRGILNYLLK